MNLLLENVSIYLPNDTGNSPTVFVTAEFNAQHAVRLCDWRDVATVNTSEMTIKSSLLWSPVSGSLLPVRLTPSSNSSD